MFEHAAYDQETVQLDPGDIVVVVSDGVSEALSAANEEFGDARLQAAVMPHAGESPDVILERLLASVREFTKGAVQNDDVTALVVKFLGS